MTKKMHHYERLQALTNGVTPDRPPISMWRHFYLEENNRDAFATAMIDWQRQFEWDFLKINPKASYQYEPWGVKMTYSPDGIIKPVRASCPIASPNDWSKIGPLSVTHPEFQNQLHAIMQIRRALPRPFPIVMTVFNPISIAGDMVPDDQMLVDHLHEAPEKVESALQAITETFRALVPEMRNAGCDGIFFATTQWASSDRLTVDELKRFGLAYDRHIWKAAGDDAFNVLHICDSNNYLSEYGAFSASLVNWDSGDPTNPSLREGYEILKRPVLGGIGHRGDLVNDSPDLLKEKIRRLIDEHRDIPFGVGPGCAVPVTAPLENIAAVRSAVEGE
jgi:uroporphyrinogen decarboxylase